MTMTPAVDLSSFPLLRIDQVHLHDIQTLLQAETQLETLLQRESGMESISPFITKLLLSVRKEITDRRANESTPPSPKPTPSKKKPRGRKPSWISNINRSNVVPNNTESNSVVSFVSSPKTSFNFRSRVKAAKESLKARSQTATAEQYVKQRAERTQNALVTMQEWRADREKMKVQRNALFEEEERLRCQRRKERMKREKRVQYSMHAAAEEAKSKALESGCTEEEAVVEAAAAASRAANAVDDGNSTADSDDESYLDDSISEGGGVLLETLFDDESKSDDRPDAKLALNKDEQDENSSTASADLETKHDDDVDCCSERSRDSHSIANTLGTLNLSSDEPQNINSLPIGTNETGLDRDVSPLSDVKSTTEASQPMMEVEQHTMPQKDESDGSQLSTPYDFEIQVSDITTTATSPACASEEICIFGPSPPRQDEDVLPANRKNGRQLCDVFPTFSSIFTKFVKTGKSQIDDSTQKELISCMQHQIKLYELHSTFSRSEVDSFDSKIESRRFYRINSRRPEVRALLVDVFSHHQLSEWHELSDHINASSWNLLWTWGLPKASEFNNLLVFQKINRFRHTKGLTRKDLLKKNMQRFSFGQLMPLTYALPHEYNSFVAGYSSIQKLADSTIPNFWIVKPIGLSRGRGISVIKDISQVAYSQPIVIQKYISNPMLFLEYKFDLRIYVLVTSFNPLEAFIYKEGLARFGSRKYSLKPESLGDTRIHLTNTSLQKEFGEISDRSHPAYLAGINGSGSKVALSWLWKRLKGQGLDTADLWGKVINVCGKALESVDADIPNQPNSFELFGFDVIFDTDEKCWLIEVNSSPSLSCDSKLDDRIKGGLIVDTISLVDPIAYDRSAVSEVCKRQITHRKAGSLLVEDLNHILPNTTPRRNGETPKCLGKFERIY